MPGRTEYHRLWRKQNPNYRKKSFLKNPEEYLKYKIRAAAQRAIKAGKIPKLPCQICGKKDVFGHHLDYDKPLEIVWLCQRHHTAIHHDSTFKPKLFPVALIVKCWRCKKRIPGA